MDNPITPQIWCDLANVCLPNLINGIFLVIVAVITYFSGKNKGQNEILKQVLNISQQNSLQQQSSSGNTMTTIFNVTPDQAKELMEKPQQKSIKSDSNDKTKT